MQEKIKIIKKPFELKKTNKVVAMYVVVYADQLLQSAAKFFEHLQ